MKWAALVPAAERPAILNQRHTDWWWILKKIPRSWTSFLGTPPVIVFGNVFYPPKPIPDPGHWELLWPLYFAFQTKGGWLFRIGMRYDDIDLYFALGLTFKKQGR